MRSVKSAGGASTEMRLLFLFHHHGIRGWRRNSQLPGKPDIIFPQRRLAVFVDGCFWHGCPKHATKPKTNAAFWAAKLAGNKARDRRVNRELRARGWKVVRIWEHELTRRNERRLLARLQRLGLTGSPPGAASAVPRAAPAVFRAVPAR